MDQPEFIELREEHIEECVAIMAELGQHYDHPIGGQWDAKKIASEIREHGGLAARGMNAGGELEIQAFCLLRKFPDRYEIMLLATRARWHRSGAMRALIRSLIADLSAGESIWLEVHAGNLPAIGLYEALGFTLKGERPDYYFDGGKALVYEYKSLR